MTATDSGVYATRGDAVHTGVDLHSCAGCGVGILDGMNIMCKHSVINVGISDGTS